MNTICITTTALNVGYRQKAAENVLLKNLNLELKSGQLVCFMGQNGVGKSTLIRTLAGLQAPLAGQIIYNTGDPNGNTSVPLPQQLAVVLTDRITAVNMTVYDLTCFGRYPYVDWTVRLSSDDVEMINDTLQEFHLSHLRDKKIHELSDGQLQMVMIARSVIQDTPIILLDEPTAHLDLNNRLEIMNLLRKLAHKHNKAILVSTHELDLALQTADLIWLAGQDKGITIGIPEDLILNGAFDTVFQFKGFDLKTGKVLHHPHRGLIVKIQGTGHTLLWTKNAFERNGYTASDTDAQHDIVIEEKEGQTLWIANGKLEFRSLAELFQYLEVKS